MGVVRYPLRQTPVGALVGEVAVGVGIQRCLARVEEVMMAVGLVAPRQREVDGQPMILVPPLPVGVNLRRTMEPALGVLLRPVVRKMRDQVNSLRLFSCGHATL